ncbi:MAG: nucleotidyltransferase domain-containing protein [Proteobacteria bacterium]|nr:nucleotidyltransferase domain-containing protein [Pseudomonadota bacterium]
MKIDKIRKNFLSVEETGLRVGQVLKLILENSSPVSIVLFGSAARNELTSSSDIDVVVIVGTVGQIKPTLKILTSKSGHLGFPVDFLVTSQSDYDKKSEIGGVFFDAKREGVILFPESAAVPDHK